VKRGRGPVKLARGGEKGIFEKLSITCWSENVVEGDHLRSGEYFG
jgi:hypothetical protein